MLNVYLSGEIHTDWRDEIINLCQKEGLDINFSSPVTNHELSDNCGVEILGAEERISDFEKSLEITMEEGESQSSSIENSIIKKIQKK